MKKNTLLIMTLISCVVVVLAVITQDDGEVITQDDGEVITQDDGEVITQDDGEVITQDDGEVITQDDGEVITQDDGEVITQDDGEVITQDDEWSTDVNSSNEQITEFELDKQRVEELQLQYDEIIEYTCMDARPQSYFEVKLKERILEAEHRLRYLAEQQSEMENIINQVVVLNEKYSESDKQIFMFYEWECVNQKFWIDEYPHLQDILDGN